jgi:sulfatase maturation enzyme AslB (radical SAM superfamily)
MTIAEWFDSEPMRQARLSMFSSTKNSICARCYHEEMHSGTSRRHKCNQKSIIFTKSAFNESYEQSPGWEKFQSSLNNNGAYDGLPIDLHIDLGNYCNLACKMCEPRASSTFASQLVKWGVDSAKQYVGTDWTRNEATWNRVLAELAGIKKLHNVHFMGGETLITSRFNDFVDYMIDCGRTDLHFSFVTNGTVYDEKLIEKLKKFQRVGIEVSIESLTKHNQYQRQGTDTDVVLSNIERYLSHCNNSNITLTIRPAISALTIGSYYTLLEYAHEKKLVVKSLIVAQPEFLNPSVLPDHVKEVYKQRYIELKKQLMLDQLNFQYDYNESDPNQYARIIASQIDQCISLLDATGTYDLFTDLVRHCRRWDSVYGYNAIDLYPELADEFKKHGY